MTATPTLRYMFSRLVIFLFVTAFFGCSRSVVAQLDFHGVKVTVPSDGHDKVAITQTNVTWHGNSFLVTLQSPDEGVVEIRRNGISIATARPGQTVIFTRDGQIESQK